MNTVTQTKQYLRRQRWKSIIEACQASGLTIKAWCTQNNVCQQSYYRNLKKYREEICETFPMELVGSNKTGLFKKLEIIPPVNATQSSIIIHLQSATLEVQQGASQQTVEAVLLALRSIC